MHEGAKIRRLIGGLARLVVLCFVFFVSFVLSSVGAQTPQRIISLVPTVTEILFAIGAGPQVVAVSSYDVEPPEVRSLPTRRRAARSRHRAHHLAAARPGDHLRQPDRSPEAAQARVDSVLRLSPRRPRAHHGDDARAGQAHRTRRAGRAERAPDRAAPGRCPDEGRVAGKPQPRTLLVFGREPGSLRNIYASAGRGFLHDMLVAAGGEDVFADIDKESAQATPR